MHWLNESEYDDIEKAIQKNGYEAEEKKIIDKLIELFKEMLTYKNKNYDSNWNFEEWINVIDTEYHYFNNSLNEAIKIVQFGYYFDDDICDEVEVGDTFKIMTLRDLYDELTDEKIGYKQFAYYYKEIELKEGQTYSDVYELKKQKIMSLFQEMLDFAGVKYETDFSTYIKILTDEERECYYYDFEGLSVLIQKYYPYYRDTIMHLNNVMWRPAVSYIALINCMEETYEMLSKNYKKRELDLQEYKKSINVTEDGYEYMDDMVFDEEE